MKRTLLLVTSTCTVTPVALQAKLIPINPVYRTRVDYAPQSHQHESQQICISLTTIDEAVMTLRLAPLLHAHGKQLCIRADATLQPLLQMSPAIDMVQPLTTIDDSHPVHEFIPLLYEDRHAENSYAYLNLDATLIDLWHDAFSSHEQGRVGLYLGERTGKLMLLAPQLHIADFIPFTLFKHIELFVLDDISNLKIAPNMVMHYIKPTICAQPQHLAAILNELDLLITTCPTMGALAWMLKKPVWLIQPDTVITKAYIDCYPGIEIITYPHGETHRALNSIMQRLSQLSIPAHAITTAVPIGELIDKMTILEIKSERINDPNKLVNIWRELASIRATFEQSIPQSPELEQLIAELKAANEAMWQTEDLIRDKEREKSFDEEFIRLARAVYIQNDRRYQAKRAINELCGSRLIEEKSYNPY
jgi:hypothetical protein